MIALGYMRKFVAPRPDWLKNPGVADLCSVSGCFSGDFADWIGQWKHNGYWLFNAPEDIAVVAAEMDVALEGSSLFFLEGYEQQYDDVRREWISFGPEQSFGTDVVLPATPVPLGVDIVCYSGQTSAGCSPLSCNQLADTISVNEHCLLPTIEDAKAVVSSDVMKGSEPGPYRIIAVYEVADT